MKFNILLSDLFEEAGLKDKIHDEKYKPLFTVEAEVDEDTASSLKSLMGSKRSHNDSKLQYHYIKQYLSGAEGKLKDMIEKSGLPETEVANIMSKSDKFTDRAVSFAEAIKKHAESQSGTQKDDVVNKYNTAMKELEALKLSHIPKEEADKLQQSIEQMKTSYAFEKVVNSIKWADAFDPETREIILKQGLDKKLEELGAIKVLKDGKFHLMQKENPDLKYFDKSNKEVTFEEMANQYAIEKKLIAVSGTTTQQQPSQGTILPITGGNQKQSQYTDSIRNDISKSLEQFGVKK